MTAPPLPASPCVRCALGYTQSDTFQAGSRFFLSYAGSPPTPGDCQTLASDIASAWNTDLAPLVAESWALTMVDVIDIASNVGSSGQWIGSNGGGRAGTETNALAATNVEYDIARRYRGGKPRMFLPPGTLGDQQDAGHWNSGFIGVVKTGFESFFTALAALGVGSMGSLAHVNLSYYEGFTNVTNSSGRTRAAPKYRPTALVDTIEGYAPKELIGSQRRRRAATTQ